MKTKPVKIVICTMIGILCMSSIDSKATDFTGKEAEYTKLCASDPESLSDAQNAECDQYRVYLRAKDDEMKALIKKTEGDMDSIKGDMNKLTAQYNSYEQQIRNLESNMIAIDEATVSMNANIVKLEEQIAIKLKYIELRDIEIKKRMFNMQSAASTNMYVDFVMGATDLVDLMRRSDGVKQITSYDQEQIRLLDADKKKLLDDKAEVVNQKEMLAEQKVQKEADKQYIEQLKTQNQELLTAYRVQEASLMEKQRNNESERQAIVANMKKVKVPGSMPTSTGWMLPVQDNYFISAGTFYYSDGVTPHLGLDFAASVGTPLYAPIDAVILYANNPCPTYGGLGQWVGYPKGGGNTVHMLGSVGGVTYAVSYFHMQQENFRAANLEEVTQGEYIGNLGSSGNSSGGHLHMEIINLGDMTIEDAVNKFNATADFAWGTDWNLSRTCNGTGGVAPCRERPEEVLGF